MMRRIRRIKQVSPFCFAELAFPINSIELRSPNLVSGSYVNCSLKLYQIDEMPEGRTVDFEIIQRADKGILKSFKFIRISFEMVFDF